MEDLGGMKIPSNMLTNRASSMSSLGPKSMMLLSREVLHLYLHYLFTFSKHLYGMPGTALSALQVLACLIPHKNSMSSYSSSPHSSAGETKAHRG